MQLEVGEILEGKVTGITNFGAFVELSEGQTGMVHISEVAASFVKEIRDFVSEGQQVKVKVLSVNDGKISLSIKQAQPVQATDQRGGRDGGRDGGGRDGGRDQRKSQPPRQSRPRQPRPPVVSPGRPGAFEWQNSKSDSNSFEDMMSSFKKSSDEKMSDLKRSMDGKSGGFSYRGGGSR